MTNIALKIRSVQFVNINNEDVAILPKREYEELLAMVEDIADARAFARFKAREANGEEEKLPSSFVKRMLAGENLIKLWREHRGLSSKELAEGASISRGFISQIESGRREASITTLKKMAETLNVTVDDLI
jgi:DNA-binding XRE family transcriptional regulator